MNLRLIRCAFTFLSLTVFGCGQAVARPLSATAYQISSADQFLPGKLADGYFDDYVLENDYLKAVIARPGKPAMGEVRGGSLIDVIVKSHPVDYFAAMNTAADPLSTAGLIVYESAEIQSEGQASPSVTLTGYVGNADASAPAEKLTVTTRYSLPGPHDRIQIDTTFTNQTSATAWLQPVDQMDWGEAQAFSEGRGFGATTAPVNFVLAAKDNFSVGYVSSGTEALNGYHSGRSSIILSSGNIDQLVETLTLRKRIASQSNAGIPAEYRGLGASIEPAPGLVVLPGTETRYGLSGGLPVPQPLYVPKDMVRVVDGKTTLVELARGSDSLFAPPGAEQRQDKISLAPGESFSQTRYLVVAGRDWSPIVRAAYAEKSLPRARLVGAVLEDATNKPIAGARVQITAADGHTSVPSGPLLQVLSGPDGSFFADVPPGNYRVHAMANGRFSPPGGTSATAVTGGGGELALVRMSPESRLRIAISEAETETSSPLPSKLTITPKPPFPPVDYGFSPDVSRGVRNTVYMPQGFAVVPLTPGRYRLSVSRGIEYDLFEKDISIAPGQELTVSASLPHVMKEHLPGMVSMDMGLQTTASATGFVTPESRAIQAACEGVSVIVSGDYGTATDLQPAIEKLGLEKWVKAVPGRRDILRKGDMSANLYVYPLDEKTSAAFDVAVKKTDSLPPDVALADLREQFPDLIFQIDRPLHPEMGYLTHFPFDESKRRFIDDNMPPPDFNAIQLVEGGQFGNESQSYHRYMAMQIARLQPDGLGKGQPLAPLASSASSLPMGNEVGYPRTYLYLKERKPLAEITAEDVRSAVAGQHFLVTNGPILLFDGLDLAKREFSVTPGEILDSSTTEIVRIRARVLEAPWLTLQGVNTRENGRRGITVLNILPTKEILRYPTNQSSSNVYARYLKADAVLDAYAYSTFSSLAPVVPDDLPDFGGPVLPFAWSGPIFVDRDGDGKIHVKPEEIKLPQPSRNKSKPDATTP